MNRAKVMIFTGGSLGPWATALPQQDDYLIGADSGAWFMLTNGLIPDLAIGDFDSVSQEQLQQIRQVSKSTRICDPVDKDYTDTELAFREALALAPKEIWLLGALGTRFDHTLANVHLLMAALEAGIPAAIIDQYNKIQLMSDELALRHEGYDNVSLLPLSRQVRGIELQGFQYPLHNATISMGQSIGISNRLLQPHGRIQINEGLLLVIQSRD